MTSRDGRKLYYVVRDVTNSSGMTIRYIESYVEYFDYDDVPVMIHLTAYSYDGYLEFANDKLLLEAYESVYMI